MNFHIAIIFLLLSPNYLLGFNIPEDLNIPSNLLNVIVENFVTELPSILEAIDIPCLESLSLRPPNFQVSVNKKNKLLK